MIFDLWALIVLGGLAVLLFFGAWVLDRVQVHREERDWEEHGRHQQRQFGYVDMVQLPSHCELVDSPFDWSEDPDLGS